MRALEGKARRWSKPRGGWRRIPQKKVWRGNGLGYSASYKTIWYTPSPVQGSGSISAAGGKLSQADANKYAALQGQAAVSGASGRAAFAELSKVVMT